MPGKRMSAYPMKTDQPESCIIIFAKAPIMGHVKTRLGANLDAAIVVNLYRNFVNDIIVKITAAGHDLKIFYDPPGSEPVMRDWLGNGLIFLSQNGTDIGQKMKNAFETTFKSGFTRAVLMGTDIPDLPQEIISDAMAELEINDAVIGPAADGGYYLIGFHADTFLPAVFKDKPWGTSSVYQKTMRDFTTANINVRQLPKWRDVDDDDDLIHLIQSLKHNPDQAKNTYAYLDRMGMIEK